MQTLEPEPVRRIDASGIGARRATPIAQARQQLDGLRQILGGGPLPLAPGLAGVLQAQVQQALEAVVVACRLADWLESQAGGEAGPEEGQHAAYFQSLFGMLKAPPVAAAAPKPDDEDLAAVRARIGEIDATTRALVAVLAESRAPLLAAVALRDERRVEALVDAVMEVVGRVGAQARALCGQDLEGLDSSSGW